MGINVNDDDRDSVQISYAHASPLPIIIRCLLIMRAHYNQSNLAQASIGPAYIFE